MISFKNYLSDAVISEAIQYHAKNSIPLAECVFRYGSEKYFEFFVAARNLYQNNLLESVYPDISQDDIELINSDLGEFALYNEQIVPLDFIIEKETMQLNKPKRGGEKKFYVYVKNPKTNKIKKIQFGDTTGLTVKYNNPQRKKAFAARHNCSDKTDKTTPGYWSCRINKYLGKTPAARNGYW